MNEDEKRALILDFEKNRQFLGNISAQKQQLGFQNEILAASLDELKNTKEKTVWKAVGNILVPKETKEMEKELKEKKDSVDLRMKTVEKQEDTLIKKLNSLKSQIEDKPKENDKDEKESKKDKDEEKDKNGKRSRK